MKVLTAITLIAGLTVFAWGSALSDLAGSMSTGEWAELTTNNINPTLSADGASGMVFGYTEDIKWDPGSNQLFYMGGDHADAAHFISYTESNNTWQRLPKDRPPTHERAVAYLRRRASEGDPRSRVIEGSVFHDEQGQPPTYVRVLPWNKHGVGWRVNGSPGIPPLIRVRPFTAAQQRHAIITG